MDILATYKCFVTIWIFARIRPMRKCYQGNLCFVTIWIFARIRLSVEKPKSSKGFVTIWIFARIRQDYRLKHW